MALLSYQWILYKPNILKMFGFISRLYKVMEVVIQIKEFVKKFTVTATVSASATATATARQFVFSKSWILKKFELGQLG